MVLQAARQAEAIKRVAALMQAGMPQVARRGLVERSKLVRQEQTEPVLLAAPEVVQTPEPGAAVRGKPRPVAEVARAVAAHPVLSGLLAQVL